MHSPASRRPAFPVGQKHPNYRLTADYDEKNLFDVQKYLQHRLKQKDILDKFMERGAISQAQHDKSLHDLIEKMAESGQNM